MDKTREIAYRLWEEAGKPEGMADHFWYQAEKVCKPVFSRIGEWVIYSPQAFVQTTSIPFSSQEFVPPADLAQATAIRFTPSQIIHMKIGDDRPSTKDGPIGDNWPYQVEDKPIDPESFNPHNKIMTRYGKKLLEEGKKYYGRITINGHETTEREFEEEDRTLRIEILGEDGDDESSES